MSDDEVRFRVIFAEAMRDFEAEMTKAYRRCMKRAFKRILSRVLEAKP